jgi:hypothetical protein
MEPTRKKRSSEDRDMIDAMVVMLADLQQRIEQLEETNRQHEAERVHSVMLARYLGHQVVH